MQNTTTTMLTAANRTNQEATMLTTAHSLHLTAATALYAAVRNLQPQKVGVIRPTVGGLSAEFDLVHPAHRSLWTKSFAARAAYGQVRFMVALGDQLVTIGRGQLLQRKGRDIADPLTDGPRPVRAWCPKGR